MSEAFLGEMRMFGFNFAPLNWAFCDGSLMPIARNTSLFSLLGTNFGGNGVTTFAIPNVQGNVVVGAGTAATGTQYGVGQIGGEATVTISMPNTPPHTHTLMGSSGRGLKGTLNTPGPTNSFITADGCSPYIDGSTNPPPPMVAMDPTALSTFNGGGLPHNNLMPSIAMNLCICLNGIFPPRP